MTENNTRPTGDAPQKPSKGRRRHMRKEAATRLRRNVGLVILNAEGKVLAGLRAHANGDKAWQLPQGGIEGRERPLTAAYRELREETGVGFDEVQLLGDLAKWTVYILPREWTRGRRFAGQKQKWFIFRYVKDGVPDVTLAKDKEFEALDWVEPQWLTDHVIDFRKAVYTEVFEGFADFFRNV